MLRLEEWLRRVGFSGHNPFARKEADEEGEDLQAYFVEHPAYNTIQDVDPPRSTILHAPRGAGKSSARRMFEAFCFTHRDQLHPLVVPMLDWSWAVTKQRDRKSLDTQSYLPALFGQVVGALARDRNAPWMRHIETNDHIGYLNWLCLHYSRGLRPAQQRQLIERGLLTELDHERLRMYDLLALSPRDALKCLVDTIRELGYATCFVLVDRIDEYVETTADPLTAASLLAPIVGNLDVVETPDLVWRLFVPSEVIMQLRHRSLIREDRIVCVDISWSGPSGEALLHKLLSNRLAHFSDGRVNSLAALVDDRELNVDHAIVVAAAGSPRRLLNLGDMLFRVCATDASEDALLITHDHLRLALNAYDAVPIPAAELPTIPPLALRPDGSLWHGDEPVAGWQQLTEMQRAFLEYLFAHQGELCRKEELIRHIWRKHQLHDESGLRKLAERVIKIVEPDPDRPIYIISVRGGHYLLEHAADVHP